MLQRDKIKVVRHNASLEIWCRTHNLEAKPSSGTGGGELVFWLVCPNQCKLGDWDSAKDRQKELEEFLNEAEQSQSQGN
jgi:hypothetical protein